MTAAAEATAFDVDEAIRSAQIAVAEKEQEVRERASADAVAALAAAKAYAEHLAGGGDPTRPPRQENYYAARSQLVTTHLALFEVYRFWYEQTGQRNPVSPLGNGTAYKIADALLGRLGEPVTFAELAAVSGTRASATVVAKSVLALANAAKGELVPRKTKVEGKVAYLVRERRPDDADLWDPEYNGGSWRPGPGLYGGDVPEGT